MRRSVDQNTHKCGDEIAQTLRSIHPFGTAKLVSRRTGIPLRTVERILDGTSAPGLETFARLVAAYPSVLMVLQGAAPWIEGALAWLEQSRLEAELAGLAVRRQRAVDALRGRR